MTTKSTFIIPAGIYIVAGDLLRSPAVRNSWPMPEHPYQRRATRSALVAKLLAEYVADPEGYMSRGFLCVSNAPVTRGYSAPGKLIQQAGDVAARRRETISGALTLGFTAFVFEHDPGSWIFEDAIYDDPEARDLLS